MIDTFTQSKQVLFTSRMESIVAGNFLVFENAQLLCNGPVTNYETLNLKGRTVGFLFSVPPWRRASDAT